MNPLAAAAFLAFAIGVTFAPWRRQAVASSRGLLYDVALLLATLVVAHLAGELVHATRIGRWWGDVMLYAAGYWYAVVGGIGVVRMVLALVPVTEQRAPSAGGITVPSGELARGRIIGVLERTLALTLVIEGQYGALGLIVAAKALARFRGLEDRDFAEYFLIGTLASLLHAVAVGVGLRLVG